jgi:hypothetical protein
MADRKSACEGKGSLGSDRSQTTERADMHELRALLAG